MTNRTFSYLTQWILYRTRIRITMTILKICQWFVTICLPDWRLNKKGLPFNVGNGCWSDCRIKESLVLSYVPIKKSNLEFSGEPPTSSSPIGTYVNLHFLPGESNLSRRRSRFGCLTTFLLPWGTTGFIRSV